MEKVRPNVAIDIVTKNSRLSPAPKIKVECLPTSSASYREGVFTKIRIDRKDIYLQELVK